MSWNYRVLAFDEHPEVVLKVCEVYYNKEGVPDGYKEDTNFSTTEGIAGLKFLLSKYKNALIKPILFAGDKFPQEYLK